jgi:hypothetical protein
MAKFLRKHLLKETVITRNNKSGFIYFKTKVKCVSDGVMVTLQILILSFKVRILVGQPKKIPSLFFRRDFFLSHLMHIKGE